MASNTEIHHPEKGDVKVVPNELVERYEERGWESTGRVTEDPTALKGQALDAALKDAGLPTSGTADEKRQRLAEHADA